MSGKAILDNLLTLSTRHGIIFATEILINSSALTCFKNGPVGALMKNNLLNEWWLWTVTKQENIYGINNSNLTTASVPGDHQLHLQLSSQHSQSADTTKPQQYHLRSQLSKGLVSLYPHVLELVGNRLPFGLAQQGVCFAHCQLRNSDEHVLLNRPAEFTEMTLQFYTSPQMASQSFDYWQRTRLKWWKMFASSPSSFIVSDVSTMEDGSQTVSILYDCPWGNVAVETISNKGESYFNELQQISNTIQLQGFYGKKQVLPAVIEATSSLEFGMLAFLVDGYIEKSVPNSEEFRKILSLHPKLSAFKVAIATVGAKDVETRDVANNVVGELRRCGVSVLDLKEIKTSIEKQFYRYDEMGIPFTALVNDKTLEDGNITLRNRDTSIQELVHISQVTDKILKYIKMYF